MSGKNSTKPKRNKVRKSTGYRFNLATISRTNEEPPAQSAHFEVTDDTVTGTVVLTDGKKKVITVTS